MVLGLEFELRAHLKTRWKDGPLDGRKTIKIIKTAQRCMSHKKEGYCIHGVLYFIFGNKSLQGKLPGLVVPWSLDVSSIPGFA
jgi:hypothetical protein